MHILLVPSILTTLVVVAFNSHTASSVFAEKVRSSNDELVEIGRELNEAADPMVADNKATAGLEIEKKQEFRRQLLGHLKSALDAKEDMSSGVLSDMVTSEALQNHLEKNAKLLGVSASKHTIDNDARLPNDLSTSFLSNVIIPVQFKNLRGNKLSPVSIFSDSASIREVIGRTSVSVRPVDVVNPSKDKTNNDSGRHLQDGPECTQLDDGSVACVLLDVPIPTLFTIFFNCPATLKNVIECGNCQVLQADGTPAELTDNPSCLGCQVCSATSQVLIQFDCSNLGSGDCVSNNCDGDCFSEGGSGGTTVTTTPSSTSNLPSDCFKTDQGNIGCALINNPATNFATVFGECPSMLTSPRECNICVVIGPDSTEDIFDNPTCTSCTVCPTGQFMYSYDCSNLVSADCAIADCDGNCLSTDTTSTVSPPTPVALPTTGPPTEATPTPSGRYFKFAVSLQAITDDEALCPISDPVVEITCPAQLAIAGTQQDTTCVLEGNKATCTGNGRVIVNCISTSIAESITSAGPLWVKMLSPDPFSCTGPTTVGQAFNVLSLCPPADGVAQSPTYSCDPITTYATDSTSGFAFCQRLCNAAAGGCTEQDLADMTGQVFAVGDCRWDSE